MKKALRKIWAAIQWILAAVFLLCITQTKLHWSSIFLLAGAVVMMPIKPIRNLLKKIKLRSGLLVVLGLILSTVGILSSPDLGTPGTENLTTTAETSAYISDQEASTYTPSFTETGIVSSTETQTDEETELSTEQTDISTTETASASPVISPNTETTEKETTVSKATSAPKTTVKSVPKTTQKTVATTKKASTTRKATTTQKVVTTKKVTTTKKPAATVGSGKATPIKPSSLPKYSNKAYTVVNNNVPNFSSSELTTKAYERYSDLDSLGRCGAATASCGKEIMPKAGEERGDISSVKPSGWKQAKYDGIGYLYNRCHLIGWQLSAENANKKNLITGTRYMNVNGMLPFENMVADYIKETGNHVAYRVTPIFEGNNLVASGVQIEAYSIEDKGDGICFNVYCYNVQPGVKINYATGESSLVSGSGAAQNTTKKAAATTKKATTTKKVTTTKKASNGANNNQSETVWIPQSGKKYHSSSTCSGMENASKISKADAEARGYTPCKKCYG